MTETGASNTVAGSIPTTASAALAQLQPQTLQQQPQQPRMPTQNGPMSVAPVTPAPPSVGPPSVPQMLTTPPSMPPAAQLSAQTSNTMENGRQSIQRCIQTLVHACQCRDANCRLPNCQKMKRVVQHTKVCKRKTNGECPTCKQLIALCCYHAKLCQEQKCLVPFCLNIRHKLKQQRLQQAQLLR